MKLEEKGANRIYLPKKEIFINNFIGGLAWGLGTIFGATTVALVLGLIVHFLGGLPLIGELIAQVKQAAEEAYLSLPGN